MDVRLTFQATRLAPSPTGALHLGHARTFLVTWWLARQCGAKIFMRMEDLDAGRAKGESVGQAYEDLRWLGMDWNAWAETGNAKVETRSEMVQSQRTAEYAGVLQALWERGAVYPCTCTRAEIVAGVMGAGNAPHEGEGGCAVSGNVRGGNAKHETRNANRGGGDARGAGANGEKCLLAVARARGGGGV